MRIAYAVVVVISNASVWIQFAVLMPVIAAFFTILLVSQDPKTNPSERDRRFLLPTIVVVTIVSTTLGIITIVAIYVSPDLLMALPDHNLPRSWEIDFTKLGHSRAEALDRLNLGYMWHAMCLLAYMGFVVGGNLIVAIYHMGAGRPKPHCGPLGLTASGLPGRHRPPAGTWVAADCCLLARETGGGQITTNETANASRRASRLTTFATRSSNTYPVAALATSLVMLRHTFAIEGPRVLATLAEEANLWLKNQSEWD